MVGYYITEDCPFMNKELAKSILKLNGVNLHQKLFEITCSEIYQFTIAPDELNEEEKKEFEELAVLVSKIYRKNTEFVNSGEFIKFVAKRYYKGDLQKAIEYQDSQLHSAHLDFWRSMTDFVYINYELANNGNPLLDLTEAVRAYSDDENVLRKYVINFDVKEYAKRKFNDFHNQYPNFARRGVEEKVTENFNNMLENLELIPSSKAQSQPGE